MEAKDVSRRKFVVQGGTAAAAGLTLLHAPFPAWAFPGRPGEEVLLWLDQPPPPPRPEVLQNLPRWEDLDTWLTPNERFFSVAHYNRPVIDKNAWRLEVTGLVRRPLTLTLADLNARPRREVVFTLDCSGNHGLPWLISGIGNARWAGVPVASILEEAGPLENGIEVIFFGADAGEEQVRQLKIRERFVRSMSIADAMNPNNLLCYEMNGLPLPQPNGFPLRLIAPGWYGIANVKWLNRIEVRETRFMGRFMARDYVTIREEPRDGEMVAVETSVGRVRLKSVPARVTRQGERYNIIGAAWGAPIAAVEVRIDDGPWRPATIDHSEEAEFAWKLWSLDWGNLSPGEHGITSRATDVAGNVQPSPDDPQITNKRTYWESNGQVTRRLRVG